MNLHQITVEQAATIATQFLKQEIAEILCLGRDDGEPKYICIRMKNLEEDVSPCLYIYPSGSVHLIHIKDGGANRPFQPVNALPITDYLRSEGFEFKY
ncbi:MAG: hypothetical protein V4439_03385 [Patescibacteria group bacterium]